MNEKIAVLFGGTSSEREISIKSGLSILKSLIKCGLYARSVDTRDFPIIQLKKQGFNKAYIALHGKNGEDGRIQGMLEYLNIPYTGSGIMASSISIDKLRTKLLWKSCNLPVAPDVHIEKNKNKNTNIYLHNIKKILKLGFPVIVKPNNQGSSIGITIVYDMKKLDDAFNKAFIYDDNILVEKFLKGSEYTISILGNKILPSIYITTKNSFYDYSAKYLSSDTQYFCPSGLNVQQEKKLKEIARKAWNILGCRGCGRIDVILDHNNNFWLLEVNTVPGMTNRSLVPIAAKNAGMSFDELILKILYMTH